MPAHRYPLAEGQEEFHRYMDEALAEHPDKVWRTAGKATKAQPNGEDETFWRDMGPKYLELYHKWRMSNHYYVPWEYAPGEYAIEMAITVEVDGSTLKGYIDRVFKDTRDGSLLIVDLKSGKSKQTSPLQLGFYRLGILQQFGVDIRYGSYYDARGGSLDAKYDLDQFSPDLVRRWIRNMQRSINLYDFTPNVGMHCSWCGMKDEHCYVWSPTAPRPDFADDLEIAHA